MRDMIYYQPGRCNGKTILVHFYEAIKDNKKEYRVPSVDIRELIETKYIPIFLSLGLNEEQIPHIIVDPDAFP